MFNGLAIVTVAVMELSAKIKGDRHGVLPIILTPIAGKIPSRRVINGTVANRAKVLDGALYMVSFTEQEFNSELNPKTGKLIGRQWNYVFGARVSALDAVQSYAALGAGVVINVEPVEKSTGDTSAKPLTAKQKATAAKAERARLEAEVAGKTS
jgi:hypothetical protein